MPSPAARCLLLLGLAGCARSDVLDPRLPTASSTGGASGAAASSTGGSTGGPASGSTGGSGSTGSAGGTSGSGGGLPDACDGGDTSPTPTSTWASDPAPTVTFAPPEVVLRKELSGFHNHGTADAAADVLYDGRAGAWTFQVPAGVPAGAARFVVSLVADDHDNTPASRYALAVWANGTLAYEGPAGLAHGAPYDSVFGNWEQRTYEVTCTRPGPYTLAILNASDPSVDGWIAIDWIELHLAAP